jgi:C1A family cysteine protease
MLIGIVFAVVIIILYFFKSSSTQSDINYHNLTIQPTIYVSQNPRIVFSPNIIIHPAKVALDRLNLNMLINDRPDKVPPFLLYKRSVLTPTRSQGVCSSCWAFSALNMLADRVSIISGGQFIKNLSVQFVLQCFDRNGCDGNRPESLLEWIEQTSTFIPFDHDDYMQQTSNVVTGICVNERSGITMKQGSLMAITEFDEDPTPDFLQRNVDNMKYELITRGPFFAKMEIYDDIYTYDRTTIYEHNVNLTRSGGHGVEIIGYCDPGVGMDTQFNPKGYGFWICRNSWDNWPIKKNDNIFAIRMGINECGIEVLAGSAIPDFGVEGLKRSFEILRHEEYVSLDSY